MNVNLDKALTDLYNRYGTRADRKVFTYLAEHAGSKGIVNITQSVIAQGSGVSKSTVPDSVNRLEDKGFLTVEKTVTDGGGTGTNIYHINPKYLTEPVEQSKAGTRSRVQETQMAAPGCVNLGEALKELGSNGVNEKAKQIFTQIALHADRNGESRVLQREMTAETHMAARTIKRQVDFLVRIGFLKVSKETVTTKTAHYYRNVYTIDSRFLRSMPAACCAHESGTNSEPRSKTNEVQGLARLGIVMADVVKEIFKLYEEKSSK